MYNLKMTWDEYRYNRDGDKPVFFIKHLISLFGCRVDIHKMLNVDGEGCFHTHPAHAIRIIFWGGYTEEVMDEWGIRRFCRVPFLWFGWVKPSYCHRIDEISNGKSSYSIWIRFRKTAKVKLVGPGW